MTNYTTAADKILEAPKQAKKKLKEAVEALEAFKKKKIAALSGKAAGNKKQLEELEAQIDAKTSELAEAVIEEDDQTIARLEEEIYQLTGKAEPLRRIVHKTSVGEAKYMQTEEGETLLRAALEAWEAAISAQKKAAKELDDLYHKGEEEVDALKKMISSVRDRKLSAEEMRYLETYGEFTSEGRLLAKIIDFYEDRYGALDVDGHTCGTDKAAKIRYIRNGNTDRGLAHTALAGTVPPHLAGSGAK